MRGLSALINLTKCVVSTFNNLPAKKKNSRENEFKQVEKRQSL